MRILAVSIVRHTIEGIVISGEIDSSTRGRRSVPSNIKTLYDLEAPAANDEIHAASLLFVRKPSGFRLMEARTC